MPSGAVAAPPSADLGAVVQFLSEIGSNLVTAANTLRAADSSAALSYRMMRVGLYQHIQELPPADASGKVKLAAPPAPLRAQLEKIFQHKNWAALLEETESALGRNRFWLDLHYMSAQALAGLGEGHAKALAELCRETAVLLKRFPALPTLSYPDGTPFASPAAKGWIESECLPSLGGGGGGMPMPSGVGAPAPVVVVQQGGGGADEIAAVVNEAKKLAAGAKLPDAIAMLSARLAQAGSAAARFRLRVGVGQSFLAAGQVAMARAVFEATEADVAHHQLEAWDPALAAASAEGLVSCYRALAKAGKPVPPEAGLLYDRVCRLDPAAALRLGA